MPSKEYYRDRSFFFLFYLPAQEQRRRISSIFFILVTRFPPSVSSSSLFLLTQCQSMMSQWKIIKKMRKKSLRKLTDKAKNSIFWKKNEIFRTFFQCRIFPRWIFNFLLINHNKYCTLILNCGEKKWLKEKRKSSTLISSTWPVCLVKPDVEKKKNDCVATISFHFLLFCF